MEYISQNLTTIILAIIAVFSGIALTLTVRYFRVSNDNSNKAVQKNNKVSGDQAGRDINKQNLQ